MGRSVYEYMWGLSEFTTTGILQDYDRTAQLRDFKIPTLLACGRYDEATPASTSLYHILLPNSEMFIFENASHTHYIEKAELYLKQMGAFCIALIKIQ